MLHICFVTDFCQSWSLPPGGLLVNSLGKSNRTLRLRMLHELQLPPQPQPAGALVEIRLSQASQL